MAQRQELRDSSQRLIGYLQDIGDYVEIRNNSAKLLGKYYPNVNETRDSSGRLVGKGNLLTTLL